MQNLETWAEAALGEGFGQAEHLVEALTHRSYANEGGGRLPSNQRLEFLGDAVLGLVMSQYLFARFPTYQEGALSRLRAAVVSEPTLARRARQLGVGAHLLLGRGEAASGGAKRDSNLADAFEALVAARYLDGGLAAAEAFILRELVPEVDQALAAQSHYDFKSLLQEHLQQQSPESPTYAQLSEEGPDHAKRFTMAVYWQGQELGRGRGSSKKEAEQAAARAAYQQLKP